MKETGLLGLLIGYAGTFQFPILFKLAFLYTLLYDTITIQMPRIEYILPFLDTFHEILGNPFFWFSQITVFLSVHMEYTPKIPSTFDIHLANSIHKLIANEEDFQKGFQVGDKGSPESCTNFPLRFNSSRRRTC